MIEQPLPTSCGCRFFTVFFLPGVSHFYVRTSLIRSFPALGLFFDTTASLPMLPWASTVSALVSDCYNDIDVRKR